MQTHPILNSHFIRNFQSWIWKPVQIMALFIRGYPLNCRQTFIGWQGKTDVARYCTNIHLKVECIEKLDMHTLKKKWKNGKPFKFLCLFIITLRLGTWTKWLYWSRVSRVKTLGHPARNPSLTTVAVGDTEDFPGNDDIDWVLSISLSKIIKQIRTNINHN